MERGDYPAHKCAQSSAGMEEVDVIVEVSAAATLLFWRRRERISPFSSVLSSFIPTWNKGITRASLAVGAEFGKNISPS